MKNMTRRILPALVLVAFSATASAAAFQLWEQNASGLGTAYAGSAAVADNASTVFFNPAGLTQLAGFQLSAGVSGIGANYRFHDAGSTGAMLGSGGNGGNAGGWHALPNFYIAGRLNDMVFLGFGVSSPFGLATEYDNSNWIGRVQAIKSEIRTVNYNPSIAFRVSDKVSLGLGVNYQTIDAEMTSYAGAPYRLQGDDSAWGWNAGALFTLSPAMRVGVSYRSAINYTLEGTRTLGASGVAASAGIKLPDTFILSVWQQVSDRWEAMGDLSYTRWSTLGTLNIASSAGVDTENFNYGNSWRIAWGAAYKLNESAKFKFGIAYDRTPVRDTDRTARVPDNDRLWLSLGGQWNAGRFGKFDLGYSYLYLRDPQISQTKLGTSLNGRYDANGHIVGVQYSVGF